MIKDPKTFFLTVKFFPSGLAWNHPDKKLFLHLKTSEILQFLDLEIVKMSEQAWPGLAQLELDVQYPRLASSADS